MKTENKQYKLKRWYPSFDVTLSVGDIIELTGRFKSFIGGGKYEFIHKTGDYSDVGFIKKCELNHPDFWELIEEEKPLFVTEDGVEVFLNNVELFAVNEIFETASAINFDFDCCKKEGWKLFFHKANADEYIWRSKPQFSYEDVIRHLIHSVCDMEQLNHLEQGFRKLTIERSNQ